MKKILLLVLAVCMLMCTNVTAYAASATPNEELCNTVVATYENIGIIPTQNNAPKFAHKEYDTQEVLDYLQASPKAYSHGITVQDITESLSTKELDVLRAGGDVSDSFTSARMDTGTPGVEWDYTVDYTVSSLPGGNGWYFKSVDCNVAVYKTWYFYTWATSGTISFPSAKYTLSPSTYPTSITVDVTIGFSIVTEATGISPIEYSEHHTATTSISNLVIPS